MRVCVCVCACSRERVFFFFLYHPTQRNPKIQTNHIPLKYFGAWNRELESSISENCINLQWFCSGVYLRVYFYRFGSVACCLSPFVCVCALYDDRKMPDGHSRCQLTKSNIPNRLPRIRIFYIFYFKVKYVFQVQKNRHRGREWCGVMFWKPNDMLSTQK